MVSMDTYVLATTQTTIHEMLFTPKLKKVQFFFIQVLLKTIHWGIYEVCLRVRQAKCRQEL
jgi:hypothetical protein